MVAQITYLWATEQLVPTRVRDSDASNLLATTERTRARSCDLRSTNAKGAHADERAVGQCDAPRGFPMHGRVSGMIWA